MGKSDESHDAKTFKTQLGQHSEVFRERMAGPTAERSNAQLRELGTSLNPHENLEYLGSAAVHVFHSKVLGQLFLTSQVTTLGSCSEALAQAAMKDLTGSMMEYYGRKRPKLRSGF